jgi:hypothetical protein
MRKILQKVSEDSALKTEELEDLICRGCPLINDCEYLIDDKSNHCKAFYVIKDLTLTNKNADRSVRKFLEQSHLKNV